MFLLAIRPDVLPNICSTNYPGFNPHIHRLQTIQTPLIENKAHRVRLFVLLYLDRFYPFEFIPFVYYRVIVYICW